MSSENLRCVQRGARLVSERRKRGGIVHGEVGENLPVDLDSGLLEPIHERVVVHVVLVGGRVDARDPEATEITLFVLAIAVGVLPTALDIFLGRLPQLAARAKGAARGLHDLLLPLQARDIGYGTRHGRSPYACSRRLTCFTSPLVATKPPWRSRRFRFDVFLVRMWLLKALKRRTLPEPVTLKRFLAPRWVFIFGI